MTDGDVFLTVPAQVVRGHGYTAVRIGGRLRVTDGPDLRGVEIECRTRPDDRDRWWFTWGGGIWMCEGDHVTEALVQVKTALRRVGP
ncbi:hypothetical protein [Actinomadura latina]|uniref:Uncharacterized protein n=1 Tax=Actinomadura latina TaxID=163603 RepID=A0A846Z8K6_9ACTN|nr:hypothetical protein [Actinomadura latina]NKZ07094.1 hypothetical protein [Actinomadura latina]